MHIYKDSNLFLISLKYFLSWFPEGIAMQIGILKKSFVETNTVVRSAQKP